MQTNRSPTFLRGQYLHVAYANDKSPLFSSSVCSHGHHSNTFKMAPGEGGYRQINKALNICAFEDYLHGQQRGLPKLEDVEQLTPRVLRILGQNPGKVHHPIIVLVRVTI